MRSIFEKPRWCFATGSNEIQQLSQTTTNIAPTALGGGVDISSVFELRKKIAELQIVNPELRLLFRGQRSDHQIKLTYQETGSFLFPTAFREMCQTKEDTVTFDGNRVDTKKFNNALDAALQAFQTLVRGYYPEAIRMRTISKLEILGIIQHYEVLPTHVLDVSSDWRMSCCFARNGDEHSYLYVFGVPQFDQPISINVDYNLAVVDLARVCPPTALRPHFQCGYAITNYPSVHKGVRSAHLHSHRKLPPREWDFTNFLLAKFRLTPSFWSSDGAPNDPLHIYFPDHSDPLFDLANAIREVMGLEKRRPQSTEKT